MPTSTKRDIVAVALAATTPADAGAVQKMIETAIGARHQRPVGDRWNNVGLLTASGSSYDHKILELTTNMHDAVLELRARQKHGDLAVVPYKTPHEAAADLLAGLDRKAQSALATVRLLDSGSGKGKKNLTVVCRDLGCGMTTTSVPRTIFQLGANHKDGLDWQQGNFGLGGATTFRNAAAVVLVTRRHPDILEPGESDHITIAVVEWERQRTTENAFYLVTAKWEQPGDVATPFSVPASDFPDFEAGTHLALIAYGTETLGRRSGDERSFDTVFNTRLYHPVMATSYQNLLVRDRVEILDGLERRMNDNPGPAGTEGNDTLPFAFEGKTYHLPIRFRIFAKPGSEGARRNFVAHGHALVITSNGQVHTHWEPQDFKLRSKLKKLYDRVLVVVESDALPLELRTSLFTADRAQLVRTDPAIRLEKELAAFLDDWPALKTANDELIREAIMGTSGDRPTIEIARKISRAFKIKGFSTGGAGTGGGGPKPPNPTPPEDLYDDPTHFEGPDHAEAVLGRAKGVYFRLNAKDGFLGAGKRAQLIVTCDHPDIGDDELTVGELTSGRVRVSVAVPENADLGTYKLTSSIGDWTKTSGGLGPKFGWVTKLEIVSETRPRPDGGGNGKQKGNKGAGDGDLVALIWKANEDAQLVGQIEKVSGKDLAAERDEYKELAHIEAKLPTIVLNPNYSPLKSYAHARAQELTDEGVEQAKERYAVGVGVALLVLDAQEAKDAKAGRQTDDALLLAARQAAARAVLSVLPDYDRLAKELDEG